MHNLGDDGFLDTINLLALPKLVLVILSKLNVCSVMGAGERVTEASAVGSRGAGCSRSRAVVVSTVAGIVVTGSDDLADQIGHVHFNVEFEEVDEGMELNVTTKISITHNHLEKRTYTKPLGRDIMQMSKTSKAIEIPQRNIFI